MRFAGKSESTAPAANRLLFLTLFSSPQSGVDLYHRLALVVPDTPATMTRFGDFQPLCRNVPSYPWCNLFYREVRFGDFLNCSNRFPTLAHSFNI
jgi:hypothetical protein